MIQYRTLLLFATSCLLPQCCSKQTPRLCSPEDVSEGVVDETFHLVTGYRSDVNIRKDTEDKVADLTYNKRCPSQGTINISTCPTYPVMNFNPHRLPAIVVEARCSCETCLSVGECPTTSAGPSTTIGRC